MISVLDIDGWGLAPVKDQEWRDLLEMLEHHLLHPLHHHPTSQLPTTKWQDHLGDATMADAIAAGFSTTRKPDHLAMTGLRFTVVAFLKRDDKARRTRRRSDPEIPQRASVEPRDI